MSQNPDAVLPDDVTPDDVMPDDVMPDDVMADDVMPDDCRAEAALVGDFLVELEALVHGAHGLSRDQAIVGGHLVRIVKIGRRMLRDLADGDGDQQFPLTRQYLDSFSSLVYLLSPAPDPHGLDDVRFDQYLKDSLVAELDLLRSTRDERPNDVERRLLAELDRALTTAQLTEAEVPGRRKIGWPSAEVRMRAVGDGAYLAYRSGSNAVHGTWIDLLRAQLTLAHDGTFAVRLEPERFRPEVLRRFVRLGVPVIRLSARFFDVRDDSLHATLRELEERAAEPSPN